MVFSDSKFVYGLFEGVRVSRGYQYGFEPGYFDVVRLTFGGK